MKNAIKWFEHQGTLLRNVRLIVMTNKSLSITEWYIPGRKRDKKTESKHLKTFAKKITKVPDSIRIPSEYLASFGDSS